jgi:hypothetical protein
LSLAGALSTGAARPFASLLDVVPDEVGRTRSVDGHLTRCAGHVAVTALAGLVVPVWQAGTARDAPPACLLARTAVLSRRCCCCGLVYLLAAAAAAALLRAFVHVAQKFALRDVALVARPARPVAELRVVVPDEIGGTRSVVE